jgi:hypothetical protein
MSYDLSSILNESYLSALPNYEIKNEIYLRIKSNIQVVMSAIYDKVKNMGKGDKVAYFKTITAEEKKSYDNYMNYQRVLKGRNKDRAKYNEYMKGIKNKSRAANPELYRIQNNKDVANYRARKTLTPDAASKVITSNLKNYIERLKAIKQVNEDVVYKKLAANVISHHWVDAMVKDAIKSQPVRRRGRPAKK